MSSECAELACLCNTRNWPNPKAIRPASYLTAASAGRQESGALGGRSCGRGPESEASAGVEGVAALGDRSQGSWTTASARGAGPSGWRWASAAGGRDRMGLGGGCRSRLARMAEAGVGLGRDRGLCLYDQGAVGRCAVRWLRVGGCRVCQLGRCLMGLIMN